MPILEIIAIFGTFAFFTQYVNHKYLKLPPAVGITIASLLIVGLLELILSVFPNSVELSSIEKSLMEFDFKKVLLDVTISFLLFASAINFEITNLKKWFKQISLLATLSVVISTFIIGSLTYLVLNTLIPNINIPFWYCTLFGAYMSPTDPIAAVAVFKNLANIREKNGQTDNPAKHIEIKLLGESLFNDGTGIWLFTAIAAVLIGVEQSAGKLTISLIQEIFGAVGVGIVLGALGKLFIRGSNVSGAMLLTLCLTALTALLSVKLHVSAPIAVVIVGLIIGHNLRKLFNHDDEHHIKLFWENVDEIINIMLFALMGLIVLFIKWSIELVLLGILVFPILLLARYLSIKISFFWLEKKGKVLNSSINIVSWGGIRGGISLALALSILHTPYGNDLVGITFVCVVLSNLIQGMTLKHIINAYYPNGVAPKTENLTLSETIDLKVQAIFDKLFKEKSVVSTDDYISSADGIYVFGEDIDNKEEVNETPVSETEEHTVTDTITEVVENAVESVLGIDFEEKPDDKDIQKAEETF